MIILDPSTGQTVTIAAPIRLRPVMQSTRNPKDWGVN